LVGAGKLARGRGVSPGAENGHRGGHRPRRRASSRIADLKRVQLTRTSAEGKTETFNHQLWST